MCMCVYLHVLGCSIELFLTAGCRKKWLRATGLEKNFRMFSYAIKNLWTLAAVYFTKYISSYPITILLLS